ncbi:MAG: glycine--tRNA ligase subunit beta [Deltaproteobacteria bacterium]|nr:glycine--tRNA ligase subunit beta [Deltaproteobacteria bacterium]
MAKDLIFEIGTEEIPAGFVPKALISLEGILRKNLESRRLSFGSIRTLGTPRRLTLIVESLAERQPDTKVESKGPQLKAAYDSSGKPTGALMGFARSQGVDPSDLKTVKTDKGEYVYAVKDIKGGDTVKILPEVLLATISQDFFGKSMRWASYDISFARPIHWILAVFDGTVVDFSYGHIKSSNITYGHRFLSPGENSRPKPIKITGPGLYVEKLKEAYVIPDPVERKKIIAEGLQKEAAEAGGRLLPDDGLLEEVTFLVEYPVIIRGSFSREFLELPRDVIVNSMREHQRYFSIIDEKGSLLPCFLTVANTKAADIDVVRKGNERVLRARLNDAKFYFEQDIKKRLADRVEGLKGVVFQAKLGTSYEKVERFTELALLLAAKTGFSRQKDDDETPADFITDNYNPARLDRANADPGLYSKYVVGRAAMLAKADLTSGVVGEFPKLQGIMGATYAKRSGEVDEVAAAIYEHYLPNVSGGQLPVSIPGAIVSVADKLDTISGCFGVGLIPTGAQDPYALRRQALGIIAIILDKGFRTSLEGLVEKALGLLSGRLTRERAEVKKDILEFFKDRLKNQLLSQGLSFDSIDAVLSAPWYDIVDAVKRVNALEGFKKNPACPHLVVSFKRVSNILKGVELGAKTPDAALFMEPQEAALFEISSAIAPAIDDFWKKGDYEKVFETLASIKDRVDDFFDKVMVMADDTKIKENRLALLNAIRNLYFKIADLSKLVV